MGFVSLDLRCFIFFSKQLYYLFLYLSIWTTNYCITICFVVLLLIALICIIFLCITFWYVLIFFNYALSSKFHIVDDQIKWIQILQSVVRQVTGGKEQVIVSNTIIPRLILQTIIKTLFSNMIQWTRLNTETNRVKYRNRMSSIPHWDNIEIYCSEK